jgi:hypothetical protein
MTTLVSKKGFNPVQRCYHLIQRCSNLVQWYKGTTTVKVIQFVIAKNNTILRVALVTYLKVAIRWVDTKQRTIAEIVSASMTPRLPVVGVPCPATASVVVFPNQLFPTIGATPLLSPPSLLYYSSRKGGHSRTSRATCTAPKRRTTASTKSGWSWEGDEWMKQVGKKVLIIFKRPPWGKVKRTMYYIWCNSKQIGEARTLAEAKRKADAFAERPKRSK